MDLVSSEVESYNRGRREAVKLILEGAVLGLAIVSPVSAGILEKKHLPLIRSPPEYFGEDIVVTANDMRIRPDESKLVERIVTVLPRSKPHIPRIVGSCHAYSALFSVPLEIAASMFDTESGFKNDMISPVFAVGGAQFMRPTAKGHPFNMIVYDEETHPDLYDLETKILELRPEISRLTRECKSFFDKRDEIRLAAPLKELRNLEALRADFMSGYRIVFARTINKKNEQRIDDDISYNNGIWLISLAGRTSQDNFSGNNIDHLFRAISIYNAGPKNSNSNPLGIAQNTETYNHITTITNKAERIISPFGWLNIGQDALMYARSEAKRKDNQA